MFLMFKAMLLFEIYSCLAALGIFVLKILAFSLILSLAFQKLIVFDWIC